MSGFWVRPVNAPITQPWGQLPGQPWGTKNPDGSGGHPGTDYGCPMGTPILAAADGEVIFAGYAEGFGWNTIAIYHPTDNVSTTYGHMEAHYVNVGQLVHAGQLIGLADSQGYSTGSHLHFEVRPGRWAFGGNPPNIDSDAWLHAKGAYGISPVQPPGPITADQRAKIKAMQQVLHVTADGGWGIVTDRALQVIRWHCLTPPNAVSRSTQVALLQEVWGLVADGIWGPYTDQTYLFWRYCFLNK